MKKIAAIGIDFGISKVHTNIISLETGILFCENEEEYKWDVLENNRGEINPDKIWNCAQRSLEKLLAKNDLSQWNIQTLSFSCFGDVFVPMDKDKVPTYPMLQFSDMRAENLTDELNVKISNPSYSETVNGPLSAGYVFPKIYWLKKNEPEIYERSAYFYNIQQFILNKMGLEPVTDYSMAARKMMFDVNHCKWSEQICRLLEKDAGAFGRVEPAATIIGTTDSFGAVRLPNKVKVVLGGHDTMCGFLGLGIIPGNDDGLLVNNAGTYNLMGTISKRSFIFNTYKITPGYGPILSSYHYQAGSMIGPTIDWFVNKVAHSNLAEMFEKARFNGECKIRMTSDPMTGNGVFEGLTVRDEIQDLFTGMIESMTIPMKEWISIMQNTMGTRFTRMRIGAGGAKSDKWIQLKADMLGIPVEKVTNLQASSVGVAIISSIADQDFESYKEASGNMVHVEKTFEPENKIFGKYEEKFESYCKS